VLATLLVSHEHAEAQDLGYRDVRVDQSGQLHIVLDTGKEVLPAKLSNQVAFSEPLISSDHRTAGWLVDYPYPGAPDGYPMDPIPGRLVLYRSGRTLRIFSTEQVFWSWSFVDGGRDVAFCTGPTHGGAALCELHGVTSGRLLSRWTPDHAQTPTHERPVWTKNLRF
jgi:hypothetical protein